MNCDIEGRDFHCKLKTRFICLHMMNSLLSVLVGRTLTLRTATILLHTSTPPTNSAWMPSLRRTCLKSESRGSLMNTD